MDLRTRVCIVSLPITSAKKTAYLEKIFKSPCRINFCLTKRVLGYYCSSQATPDISTNYIIIIKQITQYTALSAEAVEFADGISADKVRVKRVS